MTIIIDGCVAVKWFFDEDWTREARAIATGNRPLVAPEIAPVEVMNAVWKRVARGLIGADDARVMCGRIVRAFTRTEPLSTLWQRAGALMVDLGHPVYDCLYLALAEREHAPLVTADMRLIAVAKAFPGIEVIHIRDF